MYKPFSVGLGDFPGAGLVFTGAAGAFLGALLL